MYVQYGCGFSAPEGWLNFDASPTLRFERLPLLGQLYTRNRERFPRNVKYGDIVRGLPIGGRSCDGIYASHVLEHLARDDCLRALQNTRSYLKPGGIFRLVVPDLEQLVRDYSAQPDGDRFMRDSGMGAERRSIVRDAIGNSLHRWLWDERSMASALRDAGFTEVRRAQFNDSSDHRFAEVENPDRFAGCLGMECRTT